MTDLFPVSIAGWTGARPVRDPALVSQVLNAYAAQLDYDVRTLSDPTARRDAALALADLRKSFDTARTSKPTTRGEIKRAQWFDPVVAARMADASRNALRAKRKKRLADLGLRPEELPEFERIRSKGFTFAEAAEVVMRSRKSEAG